MPSPGPPSRSRPRPRPTDRGGERDRDAEGRPEQARPRDRTGRPLPYDTTERLLTEEWEYDTVEQALAVGVWLWNQERFFEAHEALEDVWHAAPGPDRDFWQGVIQVAVGCVHHQRGNAAGVAAILDKARRRLARYPDVHHGVDVEQLITFADGVISVMRQSGATVEIGYPVFPAMDDGPWFDREVGHHPIDDTPAWAAGTRDRRPRPRGDRGGRA